MPSAADAASQSRLSRSSLDSAGAAGGGAVGARDDGASVVSLRPVVMDVYGVGAPPTCCVRACGARMTATSSPSAFLAFCRKGA